MCNGSRRTLGNGRVLGGALMALVAGVAVPFTMAIGAQAQGRGGQAAPQSAQAGAAADLTGYWVSQVTEDWRFRMVTPAKGDYASVPLNGEGRRVADTWDPAKDTADGNACKAYGAAAIMRVPTRLHITWQDANTMKIETDAGQQTRLLHFGAPGAAGTTPDWQGFSDATWEVIRGARQSGGQGQLPGANGGGGLLETRILGGDLKVETSRMKAGYLRRNGVPYSENATVTEYFDQHNEFGIAYLTVTTIVHDPKYLQQDFITSTDFKKEPDALKWHPMPCSAS